MESLSLEEASKLYMALLKERFHGTTAETFNKFKGILVKCGEESETVNRSMIFSEVNAMFTKHHDLTEKFKTFLHYRDHHNREYYNKSHCSVPDEESTMIVVNTCVDFINKVKRALKDEDKFKSFTTMIIGFQLHMDVKKVEQEAFCLFKEHPELEIEFSEFLAEAKAGRTVKDLVVSKKRKREEAKERTDSGEDREWSKYESKKFCHEDKLFEKDLSYNLMLRAKEGAERLIMEHSGSTNLMEEIWIADYFRGLNLKFMAKVLNSEECDVLFKKSMERGKAIFKSTKSMERGKALVKSKKFVLYLEKRIQNLTNNWSEEKKRLAKLNRERDLQIPVFDWHAAQ